MHHPPAATAEADIDARRRRPDRLNAVRATGLLDSPPDPLFDRITRLAALTLGVPVSAFTLVDAQRDFYKSAHGFIEPLASSRQLEGRTFCQHTMALTRPLVLEDTEAWPGYRDVPTVRSMGIRAYLGVPVMHPAGQCIGTLCALDVVPRAWTERDLDLMTELALSLTRELELRAAALEAQTATQAKSAFLAAMSHEIRGPMNAILASARLLNGAVLDDAGRQHMRVVATAGQHLVHLLDDLLDLSKVEAGSMALEALDFSPAALAEEVRLLVSASAQSKGLALQVEVTPALGTRRGDPMRLRQALLNLMGNAVKFTDQGLVRLSIQAIAGDETRLRFAVTDSGIGLSPEELERLFKPFSQARPSTARHHGGSGLGLHLVQQLARLMGGRCGATSQPGHGSEFWFTAALPRSMDKGGPAPPLSDEAVMDALRQRHAGRRVMVVEDDALGSEVAVALLVAVGLAPVSVGDGAAALQQAGAELDLVLTDLYLPDMDGWALARALRAGHARRHLPIVAMSGAATAADRARSLAVGLDAHLAKPIDAAVLWRTVLHCLDGSH